jgi:radical SAM superfamily enzyme YgiQ (UPF0313 family)
MSLAVCVNANAGLWYTTHHEADELRGTKEYYSNVYNDGGDYFKCYNDGSGRDYIIIGADMGIFDYENYKYIYSDYKYMYATIGFYKNGNLIERTSFRFNLYSGDFDFAYSGDGDELSTKIINHLKNVGDVRIIAPKYSGPDFDITIPMNPNLITNVNEVKKTVNVSKQNTSKPSTESTDTVKTIMVELPKIETPSPNVVLASNTCPIAVNSTPQTDEIWKSYENAVRYIKYNDASYLERTYLRIERLLYANKREMKRLPKDSDEFQLKKQQIKVMKSKMEEIDNKYFELTNKYIYQG